MMRRSRRSIASGLESISMRMREAASSIRSMALSGSWRSRDVAMRKRGGGDDRRVGDFDAVVNFVALLQAAQDRDGVFDRRLVHEHLLEAALERGILLDVLAIFIERGRADAMQLAARQRGLEHVARIHRAFGLAGADHGVQLVDEQDDLAFLLGEIVEHGLSRSSNSPRNLAPAISAPMSSARMRLLRSPSGTSPLTMRCASPSTMAVLPTPGSPISTGLFLVRRCSTCTVRRISSSRPITGSSLPCSARSVRSTVYFSSAWRLSSAFGSFTFSPPRTSLDRLLDGALHGAGIRSIVPSGPLSSSAASTNSSLEMYWSPRFCASLSVTLSSAVELVGDVDLAGRAFDLGQPVQHLARAASAAG